MINFLVPRWSRRRELLRRIARRSPADPVMRRWHYWAAKNSDVFFVQIGSHNGFSGDPLYVHLEEQPGWHGIMVEPVPATFAELSRRRGGDPRFTLVQAAITDHDGIVTMTVFSDEDRDLSQLATLETRVASTYTTQCRDETDLCAMTFDTLTRGVADIDVLHVDAEGHDATILAQVDFDALTLSAVLFEHSHLSTEVRAALTERLHRYSYRTWSNQSDTLCLRR